MLPVGFFASIDFERIVVETDTMASGSLNNQFNDVIDGKQVEIVPLRCCLINHRRESRSTEQRILVSRVSSASLMPVRQWCFRFELTEIVVAYCLLLELRLYAHKRLSVCRSDDIDLAPTPIPPVPRFLIEPILVTQRLQD